MNNLRSSSKVRPNAGAYLLVLPLLLLTVLLAACGSSASGSPAASKTGSTTKNSTASSFEAYLTCLKQHGVNIPNRTPGSGSAPSGSFPTGGSFPGGGGGFFGNSSNPTVKKAESACASLRPKNNFGGRAPTGAQATALRTYLNCLEIHGVSVPSGNASFSILRTLFTNPTAKDKVAEADCASLRPKFPSRPSGSTTTTTPTAS